MGYNRHHITPHRGFLLGAKADVSYQYFEDAAFEKRIWMPSANVSNYLLLFTAPFLGTRDPLGRKSFNDFIITLSESEIVPRVLAFWNHAVKACVEGSPLLPALAKIERTGVKILVSGPALDHLQLKNSLRIGKLANHFDLLEAIHKAQKIVNF